MAWVELLCYVKASGVQGACRPLSMKSAARLWRVSAADVRKMLEAAEADAALVREPNEWRITNWDRYQAPSPTSRGWWARYTKHLRSAEWAASRDRVLLRAGFKCERGCGRDARHVHHKTYERLGHEALDDLEALCLECHQAEHPHREILAAEDDE